MNNNLKQGIFFENRQNDVYLPETNISNHNTSPSGLSLTTKIFFKNESLVSAEPHNIKQPSIVEAIE